jgi:acyl-CoA thioesterase YciA
VGNTSVTVEVEAWARRHDDSGTVKVTDGHFTYVALGADRRARAIPK